MDSTHVLELPEPERLDSLMPFDESYLGRLRSKVGHDLVLAPGVQVLVVAPDGRVLVQRRTDSGVWEIPAGSCEPGQSFRTAAVAELSEETGIDVAADALVPFATISDPEVHTLLYPNGDRVHAFAICFWVPVPEGVSAISTDEAVEHRWVFPEELPNPAHSPTRIALALFAEHRQTGAFIAD